MNSVAINWYSMSAICLKITRGLPNFSCRIGGKLATRTCDSHMKHKYLDCLNSSDDFDKRVEGVDKVKHFPSIWTSTLFLGTYLTDHLLWNEVDFPLGIYTSQVNHGFSATPRA